MKALSLQEPYAWLILQPAYDDSPGKPLKPIENRNWPLPGTFKLPQRIYVHASMTMYDVGLSELKDLMTVTQWLRQKDALHAMYQLWDSYKSRPAELRKFRYFGHILGEVDVIGQLAKVHPEAMAREMFLPEHHHYEESPWFFGPYGFVLANPVLYKTPILCKGMLGFFQPDIPEVR